MADYIIFDFDGTIMDTGPGIIDAARYSLSKHGIIDDRELRFFVGPPLMYSFMTYYLMSEQEAVKAVADYREYYRPIGIFNSKVYDGIPEMLRELSSSGKRLAIATSKPLNMCRQLLSAAGILNCFDYTCGTSGASKDNLTKSQLISLASERLGAIPERTVMVGDTRFDIIGAAECGIQGIGVSYGYAADGELKAAGASYIASDTAELKKLLYQI